MYNSFDDKQVFDEYIRVIEEEYTIDNTIEYDIYKEPNHRTKFLPIRIL